MNTNKSEQNNVVAHVKKKSKTKWIVLGIIAVIAVIAIASNGGSSEKSENNDNSDNTAKKETTKVEYYSLNEAARDGKFEFIIKSINCDNSQVGDEYFNQTTTGKFCIVDLSIKNIGDDPQYVSSSDQKLFASNGKKYTVDDDAQIYLGDQSLILDEINPDVLVEGKLIFDLPKDINPDYIELHDSSLSNGVKVKLS